MKKKSKETTCINPISIIGAKKHNLNNISVDIPRNQLVVLTGVSGSGKSSLAFNTLFAEGQRKYAESLNTYIRQFVNKMESAEVEVIHGLCPAIAIEQKVSSSSTKSTVGSLTEILDYLKLLFAHIGVIVSPKSGNIIQKYTAPKMLTIIQNIPEKNTVCILSKIKLDKNSDNLKIHLESFIERGYTDIYAIQHDTNQRHIIQISNFIYKNDCTYYLLFSKFETKSNYTPEDLSDFVETMHLAFTEGNYEIYLDLNENNLQKYPNHLHQEDIYFEEPNPNLFSYSNSYGICKKCNGSGTTWDLDMNLIIPNKQLSVAEGAIIPWQDKKHKIWQDNFINDSKIHNFPIHTPIHNLTPTEYNVLIKGSDTLKGVNNFIQSVSKDFFEYHYYFKKKYYGNVFCPYCLGSRLRQEALYIQVCQKNIAEVLNMNIACFNTWLTNLVLDPHQRKISNRIIDELLKRVLTLKKVGLHYLTLNRSGESLSGGETQRIFLTKNINSNLSNSMYILDEPSIGLHPRDSLNLVMVLKELRDLQNTVIVVEHDEFIIKAADYIIDLGPFAGQRGGNIVAQGRFEDILNCPDSITAQCFKKEITLPIKTKRKWTNKIILE
ncbi:MAG: excinuclease ABC subunit A, partial [Alphaproteobacteria bacterium]|nr:excinuclease ABC subunit A [Alphaproteobacteria bacterium]